LAPRKSKSNFDFGTDGENERLGFRVAVVRPGIIAFRRPTVDTTNAWLCLGSLPQFSEGYVKMKLFCSADHVQAQSPEIVVNNRDLRGFSRFDCGYSRPSPCSVKVGVFGRKAPLLRRCSNKI
jgi:hypothetical protein